MVVRLRYGTGCQQHYVMDRETGKVIDKLQNNIGDEYSDDSRLFILNPPDSSVNYMNCLDCTPQSFEFVNGAFVKLKQKQR